MKQARAKARVQLLLATRDAMLKLAPVLVDMRKMLSKPLWTLETARAISCSIETAGLREAGFEVMVMPRVSEAEAWEEVERLSGGGA